MWKGQKGREKERKMKRENRGGGGRVHITEPWSRTKTDNTDFLEAFVSFPLIKWPEMGFIRKKLRF